MTTNVTQTKNNNQPDYEVMVQFFADLPTGQQNRVSENITQIAKSVGGISEGYEGAGPVGGFGGWTEFRTAKSLRQAKLFYKAVRKYAECCAIYNESVPYEDRRHTVQIYASRVWQKCHLRNERNAINQHKNRNV